MAKAVPSSSGIDSLDQMHPSIRHFNDSDIPFSLLANALWDWLAAACRFITQTNGYSSQWHEFVIKSSENRFERVYRERTIYRVESVARALRLPQIVSIDEALRTDPRLASIHGRFIGGGADLFHVTAQRLANLVLPVDMDFFHRSDLAEPRADRIVELVRGLDIFLRNERFEVEYITPIWNLISETPVTIEDGLSIERMTDDDAIFVLQLRGILGDLARHRYYDRVVRRDMCIRRRVRLAPVVLQAFPDPKARTAPDSQGFAEVDDILSTLPLVGRGRVRAGPTLRHVITGPLWGIVSRTLISRRTFSPSTVTILEDSSLPEPPLRIHGGGRDVLRRYWTVLHDQPALGTVGVALRRLRFAAEREIDEDRIVDLMIAAEALFIERSGDYDELRFRISINAAFFLENALSRRRAVFQTVRAGYDVRSQIVHGDRPDTARIECRDVPLPEMVQRMEEIIRQALCKRLDSDRAEVDFTSLTAGP
jgi:hypothetical protein